MYCEEIILLIYFQGADGTYKLETRYTDGRVKGKYGYYDPEGVLRETTYGAEAGRGFEPEIEGLDLPPATIVNENENEIFSPDIKKTTNFHNFPPQRSRISAVKNDIRIVNGRKAILRKRLKVTNPVQSPPDPQLGNNLKSRQEQLQILETQRQQLLILQQRQSSGRQDYPRSFNTFIQNPPEAVRSSSPTLSHYLPDPYVRGLDLNTGSFSYSYK